jgi:DNA-binding response OmpR family regulator
MGNERLLVIDDEPDVTRLVRWVAESAGYAAMGATTAPEFRRIYREFRPTVVVLDVVMPETDGLEIADWLAEQRTDASLFIISGFDPKYLTAAREIARLKGLDVAATMTKPLDTAVLGDALRIRIRATG